MDQLPAQISLQVIQAYALQLGVKRLEKVGLRHVEAVKGGSAHTGQISGKIEIGRERLPLLDRHLVVNALGLAPFHAIARAFGQRGFHVHYG